jgi:transposase
MHLKNIGEDVSEQLDVIPAKIYVKRHRRQKYACKKCQDTIKIASVQSEAIAKCMAAPGLLAHVAVMKFDDHLPLYRQSEI